MSKMKTYFKDYAVAQKTCDEFNKKHWLGNIIMVLIAWFITFMTFGCYGMIKNKLKEKRDKSEEE